MFFPKYFGSVCTFDVSFLPSLSGATLQLRMPYLYISSEDGDTLKIYDVTDPVSPILKSTTSIGSGRDPYRILLSSNGQKLYIPCQGTNELVIYDVSNVASPSELGAVVIGAAPPGGRCPFDIALSPDGNYIAAAGSAAEGQAATTTQGTKIDVSNPAAPSVVDTWSFNGIHSYGCTNVQAYGDYFFFTIGLAPTVGKLVSVDIATFSTVDDVQWTATTAIGGFAIKDTGTHAYVAYNAGTALGVVDITDPTNMSIVGDQSSIWGANSNQPFQSLAYRASNERVYWGHFSGSDLRVVSLNVSDPANPTVAGYISSGNEGVNSVVVGDDDCLTLAFATWSAASIYLIGDPST